jgi:hypothetical protein
MAPRRSAPRCAMLTARRALGAIPEACQDELGERESTVGLWDQIRGALSTMWANG